MHSATTCAYMAMAATSLAPLTPPSSVPFFERAHVTAIPKERNIIYQNLRSQRGWMMDPPGRGRQTARRMPRCRSKIACDPGLPNLNPSSPIFDHLCGHAMGGHTGHQRSMRIGSGRYARCSPAVGFAAAAGARRRWHTVGRASCSWRFFPLAAVTDRAPIDKNTWTNAGRAWIATLLDQRLAWRFQEAGASGRKPLSNVNMLRR